MSVERGIAINVRRDAHHVFAWVDQIAICASFGGTNLQVPKKVPFAHAPKCPAQGNWIFVDKADSEIRLFLDDADIPVAK